MIASGLVQAGARVVVSSRNAEDLEVTAAELAAVGDCDPLPADLSSPDGAAALARAVRERFDRLDILVNNAGATWGAPLDEFPASGWDRVIHTNVEGVFHLTVALLPALRAAASESQPRTRHQHRFDRRPACADDGELQLQRQQGGGAHAHQAPRQAPRVGAHHGQRDRARPVREQDDSLHARQP